MGNVILKQPSTRPVGELYFFADCEETLELGDPVYLSSVEYVEKPTDHKESKPVIGIAVQKQTTTRVKVQTYGICEINITGLAVSPTVFISPTGDLTSTLPTDGYIQHIGQCFYDEKLFINISMTRVKRNPY